MNNEQFFFSMISGLLQMSREHEERIARLEIALKTLLDSPALDWKDTVQVMQEELNEHDAADSKISDKIRLIDTAIASNRQQSLKQVNS